jgi:hypothetical protein
MQIYGGRSFFTDAPFERMMRDARLNMIGEGSNEVLRAFIGVVGMRDVGMELKQVREGILSPFKNRSILGKFGKHSLGYFWAKKVPVKSSKLGCEAKLLGSAVRRFGLAVARALGKYGEEILEKQLVLDRIATSAMAIYTATAVLSKLDSEGEEQNLEIGRYYIDQAMKTVDRCLDRLFQKEDETIESISDKITGVRFP